MWSEVPSLREACVSALAPSAGFYAVGFEPSWLGSSSVVCFLVAERPAVRALRLRLTSLSVRHLAHLYDAVRPRTEFTAEIIASTPTSSVFVLIPAPKASFPSHLKRTYAIAEASEPVPSASEL